MQAQSPFVAAENVGIKHNNVQIFSWPWVWCDNIFYIVWMGRIQMYSLRGWGVVFKLLWTSTVCLDCGRVTLPICSKLYRFIRLSMACILWLNQHWATWAESYAKDKFCINSNELLLHLPIFFIILRLQHFLQINFEQRTTQRRNPKSRSCS